MASASRVLLGLVLAAAATSFAAGTQSGRVVGVHDGDSVEVLVDGRSVKVRLEGIDCPELGQAFGQAAKRATSDLAFGLVVQLLPTGTDRYGRTLANLYLPDGRSLNQELVRLGLAWWYRKYSSDQELLALESDARFAQLGLWVHDNPMPPWEFRLVQRGGNAVLEAPSLSPPAIQPLLGPLEVTNGYHGNTKSLVFHAPQCQFYNCRNCTRTFMSREAAIQAGYRPAGCCHP